MDTEKPEKKLEEITREEFEETLEYRLQEQQDEYNNIVRMYNTYLRDLERYQITYYRQDGVLTYTKKKKPKIGFNN